MDIDALWDFHEPVISEDRFRTALAGADGTTAVLLRTQLARALGLQNRFAEGAAELDRAQEEHEAMGIAEPTTEVTLELERGRLHRSAGAVELAIPLFQQAYEDAVNAGLDDLAADAAHMLAIVGDTDHRLEWGARALAVARGSADPRARKWIGSVENNLGWTLHEVGRFEEAQQHFDRALAACREYGDPQRVFVARWAVARGLRSLGRYEEALTIQQRLAERGPEDGYVQAELAELFTALGRPGEAAPHAARAQELLGARITS